MSRDYERILRNFHNDGPVRVRQLQRYFVKAWQSDRCWEQMRAGARRWSNTVDERVRTLARSQSVPQLQMLRNLLATASDDLLPLWNCAVRLEAFQGFGTNSQVSKTIESACERVKQPSAQFSTLQVAIDSLCSAKVSPDSTIVKPLASGSVFGQLALGISHCPNMDSGALVALLNSLETEEDDQRPARTAVAVRRLVNHLGRNPSARLTYPQYERLSPLLKKSVEDSGELEHILIKGALKKRATQQAIVAAKASATRARIQEAQRCIHVAIDELNGAALGGERCGREWFSLSRLLRRHASQKDGEKVLSVLPKLMKLIPPNLATLSAAPSSVRKVLNEVPASAEMGALRVWAALPRARIKVFEELNSSTHMPASWPEHIFQCVMSEFIQTKDARRRSDIWRVWRKHRPLLGPCLAKCKQLAESDTKLVTEWFLMGADVHRAELRRAHRALVDTLFQGPELAKLLPKMFNSKDHLSVAACKLIDCITAAQWHNVARGSSVAQLRGLWNGHHAFCAGGAQRAGTSGRRRFIVAAFECLPLKDLVSALDRSLVVTDAADLFRLWHRNGSNVSGSQLLASLVIGGEPAWSQVVGTSNLMSRRTKHAVWEALRLGDSTAAVNAAVRWPNHFASLAVSHLSTELLLTAALRSKKLARLIEHDSSRESMLGALPTVREWMQKTPLRFAVLEVAVLSSLLEISHIWHLARLSLERRKCHERGSRFDDLYKTYEIPKRSGGTRTITAPNTSLKRLQRRLLANGLNAIALHPSAHGFRREHSILTNASAHVGRQLVVNVDIAGFFPNTKHQRILSAVRHMGAGKISPMASLLLADICSFNGALPTGAPTSPAIGNIVLRSADASIGTVADRHGVAYTRYADDLTFSGGDDVKKILPFVRRVLADHGYELDSKKTQLYRRGRQQLVTNLIVNDKVNLKRTDRRRLRAAVHARCNGRPVRWHDREMDDDALRGRVALLNIVDKQAAAKLANALVAHAPNWRKGRIAK